MHENPYREAAEVLQRGRDRLVDEITDVILEQRDDLLDSGYVFHEFLENQGTRLHFLALLMGQLETSAEVFEERRVAAELQRREAEIKANRSQTQRKPRAPRTRKVSPSQTSNQAARPGEEP